LEYVKIVVVKDGENAAGVYTKNGFFTEKPEKVEIIDAVGAGDSFDAGFLYGYLNGAEIKKCLKLGLLCGTKSTLARGGTASQIIKGNISLEL
jgi:sugar/nucleoside kinase (ribokinase family)